MTSQQHISEPAVTADDRHTKTATPNTVLVGDALEQLAILPTGSVDMVLTSPPYFRLRDYGHDRQIGLEVRVEDWVERLRQVAREAHRVLTPTGTLWLNVGDTFAIRSQDGAARKSLLLAPERLALALIEDGYRLRNKIVWHKRRYTPTSARDRLASAWESLYVFTKQDSYFFDLDAIRVPHTSRPPKASKRRHTIPRSWHGPNASDGNGLRRLRQRGLVGHPLGKNPGDVWHLTPSNYRGSHHATFPVALAELAIRAGCPEAVCARCRTPRRRPLYRQRLADGREIANRGPIQAGCDCRAGSVPGLVLDPFFGVGSTALGAIENRRDWLGIELSPIYAAEAHQRIAGYRPAPARPPNRELQR